MLGIFLANRLAIHHFSLNILLLIAFLSLFYFSQKKQAYAKRWSAGLAIYFFLFLFGYQSVYYQNDLHSAQHFKQFIAKENLVLGVINNVPSEKNGRIKIELATQSIGTTIENFQPSNGKLLVYLKKDETNHLKYGDQLLIKSKIFPIQSANNPNVFNFQQYLHFQNIHFQSFVNNQKFKVLAEYQGIFFWKTIFDTRNHYLTVLEKYIKSEETIAIASALMLGYKDKLNNDLKITYRESGAIHVLAVSGLHVGIISGFLSFLLQLLPFKGRIWAWGKLGFILIAIWLFAFLTGLSPSVQRAAIMFSALNFGWTLQRDVNIYNALAIAAFFILLSSPYALFDVGFQFSFLAVTGIVFFMPKLQSLWMPKNLILYYFWSLTIVSISAQLAIFPLMLYYFHQIPSYFWLSSLFVVPLAGILMKLGIFLFLTHGLNEFLSTTIGSLLTNIIALQNDLIQFIKELPFSSFSGFWINQLEVLLLYGIVLGLALLLLTYQFKWIMSVTCCLLLVSCVQFKKSYQQNQQQKITVYSINKNSVIDFTDGQTTYTLGEDNLSESQRIYTLQNNRWAIGSKEVIGIKNNDFQATNLIKKGKFFQFHNKRLVFINQEIAQNTAIVNRFRTDYILLQNNPDITLTQLTKHYKFRELIFDGSNDYWFVKKWKAICEKEKVAYQDVKNEGAYVINTVEKSTTPYYEKQAISFNLK